MNPHMPPAPPDDDAVADEAARQQALLQALLQAPAPGGEAALASLALRAPQAGLRRGLQVYQANAGAAAARALAAAYPTVTALIGEASMGALARVFWQDRPPLRGDLGEFGADLPAFIADSPMLASEPYLPDVAQLDWLLHQATRAADPPDAALLAQRLHRLGDTDPARLRLRLVPGSAVLRSAWPVVAIWQAHQPPAAGGAAPADRFADVRDAMARRQGETACVWRQGWQLRVAAVEPAQAGFDEALLQGRVLSQALDATPALDFAAWLADALRHGRLADVEVLASA